MKKTVLFGMVSLMFATSAFAATGKDVRDRVKEALKGKVQVEGLKGVKASEYNQKLAENLVSVAADGRRTVDAIALAEAIKSPEVKAEAERLARASEVLKGLSAQDIKTFGKENVDAMNEAIQIKADFLALGDVVSTNAEATAVLSKLVSIDILSMDAADRASYTTMMKGAITARTGPRVAGADAVLSFLSKTNNTAEKLKAKIAEILGCK